MHLRLPLYTLLLDNEMNLVFLKNGKTKLPSQKICPVGIFALLFLGTGLSIVTTRVNNGEQTLKSKDDCLG